jgi:hypothetical protein
VIVGALCAPMMFALSRRDVTTMHKRYKRKETLEHCRHETKVFHHILDKQIHLHFNFLVFEPAMASKKIQRQDDRG